MGVWVSGWVGDVKPHRRSFGDPHGWGFKGRAGDGGSLWVVIYGSPGVEDAGPSQAGILGPPRAKDRDEGAATSTRAGKGPRGAVTQR